MLGLAPSLLSLGLQRIRRRRVGGAHQIVSEQTAKPKGADTIPRPMQEISPSS